MAHSFRIVCSRVTFLAGITIVLLCTLLKSNAALPLDPPESFFTNVADRLLQQQLGMRIGEVQVAPTNHYSAAVHRIFQVAANIYDATSTNELPAVFKPLFDTRANGVFLAGFTNDNSVSTLDAWIASNPYGIPMVIAARKGFPNFNELTIRSDITVTRKLQVERNEPPRPGVFPVGTNQMYLVGLSNYFGLEAWNSYAARYPRAATITVSNFATMWMSNDFGIQTSQVMIATTEINLAAQAWRGAAGLRQGVQAVSNSFVVPFSTNQIFLSNAVYSFTANRFENRSTNTFESDHTFKLPYWVFVISNRVTYLMSEGDRIVDFVLLHGNHVVDLHRDLLTVGNPYVNPAGGSAALANLWNTNRNAPNAPTAGVIDQAQISLGIIPIVNSEWRVFGQTQTANENDKQGAIDSFRFFCGLMPLSTNPVVTNVVLTMETPFNPAAKLSALSTWQANDPLVHYTGQDVTFLTNISRLYVKPTQTGTNIAPSSLGMLNDPFSPWGGKFNSSAEVPDSYDRSLKDPGVYTSDDWQFPTNQPLATRWLGRIHRGTPWQSLYFKADATPAHTWLQHRGDLRTHPTNDWRIAALLASLLNTNDVRTLTSVNTTNFDSWEATLTGLTVLSNTTTQPVIGEPPSLDTNVIAAGAPQIATIVTGINRTRAAQRGQYFADASAFLSVPELSSVSPWLNLSDSEQLKWGLTDEAYEMLPSQLLSLVRADPVATATRAGDSIELRFTAFDGHAYRLESTADFAAWTTVSEPHYPSNGVFTLSVPPNSGLQFFRAVLLP
jgi:hypothetical protein